MTETLTLIMAPLISSCLVMKEDDASRSKEKEKRKEKKKKKEEKAWRKTRAHRSHKS